MAAILVAEWVFSRRKYTPKSCGPQGDPLLKIQDLIGSTMFNQGGWNNVQLGSTRTNQHGFGTTEPPFSRTGRWCWRKWLFLFQLVACYGYNSWWFTGAKQKMRPSARWAPTVPVINGVINSISKPQLPRMTFRPYLWGGPMSLHWKNEPLVIEVQNYHIQLFAGLPDSQVLDLWLRLVVQILMVSGWICPGKQFVGKKIVRKWGHPLEAVFWGGEGNGKV